MYDNIRQTDYPQITLILSVAGSEHPLAIEIPYKQWIDLFLQMETGQVMEEGIWQDPMEDEIWQGQMVQGQPLVHLV